MDDQLGFDGRVAHERNKQINTIEKLLVEDISGQLPEVVFIASGGIKKVPNADKPDGIGYRSLSYDENDLDVHGFVTGGKMRVIAGAEIAKKYPNIILVTTSKVEEDAPSHAKVMASELEKLGVPVDQIMLEECSDNTASELIEMVKLAVTNNWTRLGFITSDYHVPRVQVLFDHLEEIAGGQDKEFLQVFEEFKKRRIEVNFIKAEKLLEIIDPKYQDFFAEVRKSDAYQQRLDAEARGVLDIIGGKYRWQKRA